jgi:hypothetical protein
MIQDLLETDGGIRSSTEVDSLGLVNVRLTVLVLNVDHATQIVAELLLIDISNELRSILVVTEDDHANCSPIRALYKNKISMGHEYTGF